MKIFALLGLASLVYADNDGNVVRRRRLALQKCSFPALRAGAHDPNCLATFSWAMDEATGDAKTLKIDRHQYKCCIDKHPGWTTAGKLQQSCTAVATDACKAIKADDAVCQGADKTKKSFFAEGYKFTACNDKYSDDCRSSITCDTAGGFIGYPDLACQTGFNKDFFVRGCGRGDAGELGVDLTKDIMIVAPHTAPEQNGNPKNSFQECRSSALHYKVQAFHAGNGGCDQDNVCNTVDTCGVLPTWTGKLEASESEDTWLKPFLYKSAQNEPCADTSGVPSGTEAEKTCPNSASNSDTATYGGFDLYGERFSCWRNIGGAMKNFKRNEDMKALDITTAVISASVNAGIAQTLNDFEKSKGRSIDVNGVNGVNGEGWGVCTETVGFGGCTAELSALMCEAYNKQLVKNGQKDRKKFCIGFVLHDSTVTMGEVKTKKGKTTGGYTQEHDHDMLVGFMSVDTSDEQRDGSANGKGGWFKTIKSNEKCLVTSTASCSRCETCLSPNVRGSDGLCVDKCPKFQYAKDGVCYYRTPHCIEGNDAGTTCSKCHAGYGLNADKTKCEEIGCTIPAANAMKNGNNDLLVGSEQGTSAACVATQNLAPGDTCGITCGTGKVSTDPAKTHVYSCPSKGDLKPPTIVCAACGVAKCASCPSNPLCDVCENGYVLSADKKKCEAKACPNGGSAGACTVCPLGTAGTLGWNVVAQDWDTSACKTCTVSDCKDCAGDEAVCKTCNTGYAKKAANGKECIELENCPYGEKGTVTWDISNQKFVKTGCKADTEKCHDTSQTEGKCTDCGNGYAGSVDWDYAKQKFNSDQCHAVACPLSTETSPACNTCPPFTTGKPEWDDLFNQWAGCVANDFGFSGPSASWAGTVSADANVAAMQMAAAKMQDMYVIEAVSAEQLHVANAQFDAIKEEWVCDKGYAGVGCKQRLCPETVAFTSGNDGFTPSKSSGLSYTTDAGTSTSSTFSNQHSYRQCGGRGTCDFETGICQCFPGFTGVGCRRTTCPNSCSGHGVCMNDDIANYHAASAGNGNLPAGDIDVNTWGNLWSADKFQGCKCDGGWGGNDCSLRQCPRGDDPETQCADEQGNDIQYLTCTGVQATTEQFFNLRFTDLLGNRYNTRAIVIHKYSTTPSDANQKDPNFDSTITPPYLKAASHSIQTALESLPNFAIPQLEVTTVDPTKVSETILTPPSTDRVQFVGTETCATVKSNCKFEGKGKKRKEVCDENEVCTTKLDYAKAYTLTFEIKFTDARNSGKQALLEVRSDVKCDSGVQPKFTNTLDPTCTVTRQAPLSDLRENAECSNRGLCNRKTAECNCFDGYTGLACDTVAQTY